ncbi:MAG: transglutaminase family protein [Synechococcaceae cyanobacterium]|nr:transglutaminase family protein [Synechococcaceae cyanobacterium]
MPLPLTVSPTTPPGAAPPDWMAAVALAAEARFREAGIQLTLGGEPTLVPDQPEGPEWSVSADGPTKLPLARRLGQLLQQQVWPGSTLLFCPGKRYEGEVNPRWALRLFTGSDGQPPVHWPEPCQPGLSGERPDVDAAMDWLGRLQRQLGLALHPLRLSDPLDPQRHVWAAPLSAAFAPDGSFSWQEGHWPLDPSLARLSGAPGPAGLRLPLEHFPDDLPRQVLTLEIDADGWELFLPPLTREPLLRLLQAVADSLAGLAAPRLSGMLPVDMEGHWQVLGLTADPGVLEVNLPVCHGWADYHAWLERLQDVAGQVGLRSWKATASGGSEGTGGGNHLLWGGPDLSQHPFFSRPAWLAAILRFWQQHPCLAYLFSGDSVGPSSQAPRPDEAAGDVFDLELAYQALEQAQSQASSELCGDHRGLIGETLRHLHADRSGNNHRSEISFDKFWNPGAPAGCLGLVEFRALESLPQARWSSAIALLWSALAAHLLEPQHRRRGLRDWGPALHDRQLLPSQLWADLERLLETLAADGLRLDAAVFREIWEWRFPPLLVWEGPASLADGQGPCRLELRPALEPWPLICDTPLEGGFTSRFIDGSLRRFEVIASPAFRQHCSLWLDGRPLPLQAEGGEPLAVRVRAQRLFPCLHPAIAPHSPLELLLRSPDAEQAYALVLEERSCRALPPQERRFPIRAEARPWLGRRSQRAVSIDLRLEEVLGAEDSPA